MLPLPLLQSFFFFFCEGGSVCWNAGDVVVEFMPGKEKVDGGFVIRRDKGACVYWDVLVVIMD